MEPEVTPEMQAALNIKLAEDVRALIRSELKAALEDYGFLSTVNPYDLASRITGSITASYDFETGVKRIIQNQMSK